MPALPAPAAYLAPPSHCHRSEAFPEDLEPETPGLTLLNSSRGARRAVRVPARAPAKPPASRRWLLLTALPLVLALAAGLATVVTGAA